MSVLTNQYRGANVIVTGHTGFKGTWLCLWLLQLGAKVSGISIDIPSKPSHFISANLSNKIQDYRLDIRDDKKLKKLIHKIQPDYVFHLAAQALVRFSYETPIETFSINTMGSVHILDALRTLNKDVVAVMITSDKAYDNVEWIWGYRETDRLGGKDPYSASKGMAELAIRSYVESFLNSADSQVTVGIARAGNVIGGGDWALDRIIPDCIRAWSKKESVDIRSPESTRPWQHVLEPLSGYLLLGSLLAQKKINNGEAYNFGPPANQNYSVRALINEMSIIWGNVKWTDTSQTNMNHHEAALLKLNCDKALADLDWTSNLNFEETVRMTIEWYKAFYEGDERLMYDFTLSQINEYSKIAKNRNQFWTT